MNEAHLSLQVTPCPAFIAHNVPLADKNWFKTGGNARFFAQPATPEEFQEALLFAATNALPLFILGEGANILISDDGFDGLVIRPALQSIEIHEKTDSTVEVTAGAGVSMSDLIEYCLQHSILGLEEFSGIPGTVGGSVYINLHYFEFLLAQFLVHARVIHSATGAIQTVTKEWFAFGYNTSKLLEKEYYLTDATFALKQASDLEIAYARGRRVEIIRHRASRYPTANTCGSFFRNFHPDEIHEEIHGKKIIFVAYYLDKIGVKGSLRIGNAAVSHQHANMLINCSNATSSDIIQLARTMQELVFAAYKITPQPECQLIGFKTYPLL